MKNAFCLSTEREANHRNKFLSMQVQELCGTMNNIKADRIRGEFIYEIYSRYLLSTVDTNCWQIVLRIDIETC